MEKNLTRQKDYIKTRKSGFKESIKIYKCFECDKCIYQKSCNKYSKSDNPQTKSLRFNAKFIKYREQSYANITSAEGIDERLNRSIQAEGMFSKLKEGLNYNRFRHRGLRAVICDIHLIAMGMNLNQLHRKLLKNQTEVIKYRKAVWRKKEKIPKVFFVYSFLAEITVLKNFKRKNYKLKGS